MAVEGYGAYLRQLMAENQDHACNPRCLANALELDYTNEVNAWLRGHHAPKLNSKHIPKINDHLKLTSAQRKDLLEAQIRKLQEPRKSRQKQQATDEDAPPPPGPPPPPPFANTFGKAVAKDLITLLEDAPSGTGRDEAANTITLTWRSHDPLLMTPEQGDRWRAALQTVLRNGWQIHYLVQLDKTGSRTVRLVEHMLDFIGIGAYVPRHFTTYPATDTDIATSDLLVIPGFAAALVYSARTPHRADAGIVTHDLRQIDALAAHARQLEGATAPLLQSQSAPQSPAEAVEAIRMAEQRSRGRRLFKNGLSAFTQPPDWFSETSALGNPDIVMTADEWNRCLLHQRKRIDAFKRSVKRHRYRDICPLSALESMTRDGAYPRDDLFVAHIQPRERRLEHLQNAIDVLNDNDNYQIGFVNDNQAASIWNGSDQRLDMMWQVTDDDHVYIGTWGPDAAGQLIPVNLHISEPTVAQGFREHFDQMWEKIPPRNREREHVIQRLRRAMQTIEEDDTEE